MDYYELSDIIEGYALGFFLFNHLIIESDSFLTVQSLSCHRDDLNLAPHHWFHLVLYIPHLLSFHMLIGMSTAQFTF